MRWTEEEFKQYEAKRLISQMERGLRSARVVPLSEFAEPIPTAPAKPIIRQSRKGPNKTERRFELECLEPWQKSIGLVGYQFEAITLKLANGVRYTPDYVAYGIGAVRVYEVKGGFIREDAKIKLKFAAQQFHFFEFYLAQYTEGEWFIHRVLP